MMARMAGLWPRSRNCSTRGFARRSRRMAGISPSTALTGASVYLHMKGACAGCPSSTLTLKMGIENLLRHYIPEVTEVRPVAA